MDSISPKVNQSLRLGSSVGNPSVKDLLPLPRNNGSLFPVFIPGVSDIGRWLPSLICYPFGVGVQLLNTTPLGSLMPGRPVQPQLNSLESEQRGTLDAEQEPPIAAMRPQVTNDGKNGGKRNNRSVEGSNKAQDNVMLPVKKPCGASIGTSSSSTVLTLKPVHHCNCSKCSVRAVDGPGSSTAMDLSMKNPPTSGQKFPCSKCGKEFRSERSLKHHRTFYTVNKSQSVCFFCKKVFDSSFHLNKHLFQKHMSSLQPTFRCYYCSQTFSSQTVLDTHVVRHLSRKPFLCPKCPGKSFRKNSEFQQHYQKHG